VPRLVYQLVIRNDSCSITDPEVARDSSFNSEGVNTLFFDVLEAEYNKIPSRSCRVFNVDEVGPSEVQTIPRVLGLQGSVRLGR
jgi:hypothetical protein